MHRLQRHQIAAMPIFTTPQGGMEVCLITSRGSGRWIIPKGNPIPGLKPHEAAAREAYEEAGLVGRIEPECLGTFELDAPRGNQRGVRLVDVYLLQVERQISKWAERRERQFLCCGLETALSLVCSPSLAEIISRYARQAGLLQAANRGAWRSAGLTAPIAAR